MTRWQFGWDVHAWVLRIGQGHEATWLHATTRIRA
jgi:hypothetical protein